MSGVLKTAKKSLAEVDIHVRTIIIAKIDFNGCAEVSLAGQDIDMSWLRDLITLRINEIMNSTRENKDEPSNDKN